MKYTDIPAIKNAADKLSAKFPKDEDAVKRVGVVRKFIKETLDYVKHLIVVATIVAAGEKSGSAVLVFFGTALTGALVMYVLFLLSQYHVRAFKDPALNAILRLTASFTIITASLVIIRSIVTLFTTTVLQSH